MMHRRAGSLAFCVMLALSTTAVAQPRVVERVVEAQAAQGDGFRVTQVLEGLQHPWAVAWLPDGRMLVSERPGRLLLVHEDRVTALDGLPRLHSAEDHLTAPEGGSQGGLMDVVVHPDYVDNGWIYMTYTSPGDADAVTDGSEIGTAPALARARLNDAGTALVDLETLYVLSPRTNPARHYGSRIVFPGDGTVFMTIGDRGLRAPAQDLTNAIGSIVRLDEDGGAAEGNPFIGAAPGNLRPEIYSYGHRNNQGLAMDPASGALWTTEHGPSGGDLLHKVEAGHNYGWPQVAHGREYGTGEKVGIGTAAPGVTPPRHVWEDSNAPSGLVFYTGEAFPAWQGQLFAGQLYTEQVHRIELDGDRVTRVEPLLGGIGRVRDVRQGPEGNLYVVTDSEEGGIYRVAPASP